MKKIICSLLCITLMLIFISCEDKKSYDDSINVLYYTFPMDYQTMSLYGVEPHTTIEQPDDPVRNGFTFAGWYKDTACTIPWDFENDTIPEHSVVIYAKWVSLEWLIIYNLKGGVFGSTENPPLTYRAGQYPVVPSTVTKTGHIFDGWFLYESFSPTQETKPGDKPLNRIPTGSIGDIELWAHFTPMNINVTYNAYNPETKTKINIETTRYKYGAAINFQQLANTEHYDFLGWFFRRDYTAADNLQFINGEPLTKPISILNIYALWRNKETLEICYQVA